MTTRESAERFVAVFTNHVAKGDQDYVGSLRLAREWLRLIDSDTPGHQEVSTLLRDLELRRDPPWPD